MRILGLGLIYAALVIPCTAETITVNGSGGADFVNIQDAIDYSLHGDIIEVWPGLYNERINFYGLGVTITSTDPNDASVVEETVIDAGSSGNAVTFDSGEDDTSVLVGFTVQNGDKGIYCYYSDPAIKKCVIKNNNESGIYGVEAQPTIGHCRIIENGGSVNHKAIYDCDGVIFDCMVTDNIGRGMSRCDGPISGCAVSANSSFGLEMCAGILANSVVSGNGDSGIVSGDGQIIVNCTIVGNKGNGYTYGEGSGAILSSSIIVLDGVPPEPTDIHRNPLFAEDGFWDADPNWVQGDYHLKSEIGRWDPNTQMWIIDDVSSPCIDAGHPAYPTGYEPYPDGGTINQGAYGGTEQASKSPNGQYTYCTDPVTCDIDEDCRVGVSDFTMVVPNWLQIEELEPNMVIQEWADRYNGPDNDDDDALAVAVDSWGSVYVTGWSEGIDTAKDYVTIKYDSSGTRLWADRYNGPGNDYDRAVAIAVDNLDNVYVTGSSKRAEGDLDYATIKYDPNGSRLWVKRYNGSAGGHESAWAIDTDSLGNVYVTGWSEGAGTGKDFATIKYDPNGIQLWAVRYDNPDWNLDDEAQAMAIDAMGNIYVTGSSNEDSFTDHYTTIKYDPNGNEIWVTGYSYTDDEAKAIAIDSLGNICVTGNSNGSNGRPDYATVKYDPNGNELWVVRYNGPGDDGDYANDIVINSFDNVCVTGSSEGAAGNMDYATIKYDPNGSELWVTRYDGPGNGHDYGLAMAVDSLDNIYVCGDSAGASGDYATVKYDPNGNELGTVRYDGPGNGDDSPSAIAIDSPGNVYVTGWSQDSGYYDYLTIKYVPSYSCTTIITGDFNNDCKVDFADFATMSLHWLECNLEPQEACWE
jgi:uncharacterized delta-60 repeat protein